MPEENTTQENNQETVEQIPPVAEDVTELKEEATEIPPETESTNDPVVDVATDTEQAPEVIENPIIENPENTPEEILENVPVVEVPLETSSTEAIHEQHAPEVREEIVVEKREEVEPKKKDRNILFQMLDRAKEIVAGKKSKKLEKIMVYITTKKHRITNDDVEYLLHVSDSTAARYLSSLVKSGHLRRSGTTSTIYYERT